MLVTSIFSFSHNVFKRLLCQGHSKLGLCGKEFREKEENINAENQHFLHFPLSAFYPFKKIFQFPSHLYFIVDLHMILFWTSQHFVHKTRMSSCTLYRSKNTSLNNEDQDQNTLNAEINPILDLDCLILCQKS